MDFFFFFDTVMVGVRFGFDYFQNLCGNIFEEVRDINKDKETVWNRECVSTVMEQYHVDHFIDTDPTHFPCSIVDRLLPHPQGVVCGHRAASATTYCRQ